MEPVSQVVGWDPRSPLALPKADATVGGEQSWAGGRRPSLPPGGEIGGRPRGSERGAEGREPIQGPGPPAGGRGTTPGCLERATSEAQSKRTKWSQGAGRCDRGSYPPRGPRAPQSRKMNTGPAASGARLAPGSVRLPWCEANKPGNQLPRIPWGGFAKFRKICPRSFLPAT